MRSPSASSTTRQSHDKTETELVHPSLENLRSSREIQDQVDAFIIKEDVFIIKEIPWPQNYILGGTSKSRVSYDRLSIFQWVSDLQ